MVPTLTAFAVTQLLESYLGTLVDYEFTARMENDLDTICNGEKEAVPWLKEFYFGENADEAQELDPEELVAKTVEEIGLKTKIAGGAANNQ